MTDETAADAAPKKDPPIKIKTFIEGGEIETDLSWSPNDLTAAYQNQASLLLHYGRMSAEASTQVDRFKLTLETAEAKVYRLLRDEAATNGTKVTEEQLKRDLAAHPAVIRIKTALNAAKQVESTLKTAVEAFRHRKDMLVSQGLLSREEMRGDLRINARDLGADVEASMAAGRGGRA